MRLNDTNTGGAPTRRERTGRRTAIAALVLGASVAGWTAGSLGTSGAAASAVVEPAVERLADGAVGSYAPIVDRVTPAVVTIRAQRTVRTSAQQLPESLNPFFREFFGDRLPDPRRAPERREGGMGSGVIVRAEGYILTNDHVVSGADRVRVELSGGRQFDAKVVGTDQPSDLAVLKVDASGLPTLALGDSDSVRVGDIALAVGNPLGIGQTVTMGIVSAKGRATGLGDGSFEDFIQTDAPINRGNSGGALVNTRGELIGINSQIVSPSGGNIGIGFAIPANMARNVMGQLIEHGEVRRGRLGVTVQDLTPDLARGLRLESHGGALVSDVDAGGPAARAGLQRGDVITALNGEAVTGSNDLRNEIAALMPGTEIELKILRDGSPSTRRVELGELPGAGEQERGRQSDGAGSFGLSVEPLTADRARQLDVSATRGVVIAAVEPGSAASDAGLRPGDVIAEVDRNPVTSAAELRDALGTGERPAVLLVHRGQTTIFVTLNRG